MKQYLLAVHTVEGAPMPSAEEMQTMFAQVDQVNAELRSAGVWVFGGGLLPPDSATVVRVEGGVTTMTDGPFAETKEHLGGFWVIRCADLDQALVWAEKCAQACMNPVEVRPFDDEPGE
ncbi:MAG TPA: YciI family protein [Pseudonocardiaceae bacterium]